MPAPKPATTWSRTPRKAPTSLVSGVATPYAFPSVTQPTLFVGDNSFVINVPTGATRLDITLTTTTGAADLDMYVRYGADVNLSAEGRPEADHSSSGNTGNERVRIDATGWNGNDSNDVYQRYSRQYEITYSPAVSRSATRSK